MDPQNACLNHSLRSVLKITIPILITSLSVNLLNIIDRFMLAHYAIDSMNAAMIAGCCVSIFTFLFTGIAEMSEIFVGQYNGSRQFDKLAAPVWQMLYMAAGSILIFIPIAYFSDTLNFLPSYFLEEGLNYQRPLLYFACFPIAKIALSGFFIGQGKTKLVTSIIVLGIFLNVVFNSFLIYAILTV